MTFYPNVQIVFNINTCTVNPAESKHKVYRRNPQEWYPGHHQINWDIDVAELQEADTVDIHLFSLMVIISMRGYQKCI